jgi:hypothetical protein
MASSTRGFNRRAQTQSKPMIFGILLFVIAWALMCLGAVLEPSDDHDDDHFPFR